MLQFYMNELGKFLHEILEKGKMNCQRNKIPHTK